MGWWYDMGPDEATTMKFICGRHQRGPDGWAQFGYVKMPDYRWGIFSSRATRSAK